MELAPGLHRIGNDIVAAYLVVDDSGITLIDAGIAGQYADLARELASIGRSMADIRGIVLTHSDSDHIGFAERLRREIGIPVYVGMRWWQQREAARLHKTLESPAPSSDGAQRDAGVVQA